jgi:hypothetical protein
MLKIKFQIELISKNNTKVSQKSTIIVHYTK